MVKITIITKNTIFCISYLGPNFFADSDPPMFSEAKTTNQSRTRAFRPASASHADHQPPPSSSEQSRVNIDHQLSRDSGDLVHPCNSFHPGQSVHGARLGLSAARPVQLPSVGPHQTVGEPVVCFKCKMCGFLCLSSTSLRHHLIDDHEETGLESDLQHFLAANCSSRRNPTHLPGLSQYIQFWSQLQSAFKRGSWMGRCASRCRVWSQE